MGMNLGRVSQQTLILDHSQATLSLINLLRSKSVTQNDIELIISGLIQAAMVSSKLLRDQEAKEVLSNRLLSSRYLLELRTSQEQFVLEQAFYAVADELRAKYEILGITHLLEPTGSNCSLTLGLLHPSRMIIFALPNERISV